MSFAATWMDLAIIMLREATKKKQINDIAYLWNPKKKKECKLIYLQNRKRITDSENKLVITKEERGCGEGDKLED